MGLWCVVLLETVRKRRVVDGSMASIGSLD